MTPSQERAINNAMQKAYAYGRRAWVEEEELGKAWRVFSPNSGEIYTVFRYHYTRGENPHWTQRYGCNCLAAQGDRLTCWHRYRVHMILGEE